MNIKITELSFLNLICQNELKDAMSSKECHY